MFTVLTLHITEAAGHGGAISIEPVNGEGRGTCRALLNRDYSEAIQQLGSQRVVRTAVPEAVARQDGTVASLRAPWSATASPTWAILRETALDCNPGSFSNLME
ncbi:hypothetical protein WJ438_34240 [Streptomyces sp. GD-15H]|uniref:hypothetical protein n=1 Tax=Streptomyces sp. GD-15H TaxID=3129112 RepID=UPI0032432183